MHASVEALCDHRAGVGGGPRRAGDERGNGKAVRSSIPKTAGPTTDGQRVTVTLPIHPLYGRALPLIRTSRHRDGRQFVIAEHPAGWSIRLPLEWTDRGEPAGRAPVGTDAPRGSVEALRGVARTVRTILDSPDFLTSQEE